MRRQELVERRPFLLLAAACFLLGVIGCGFYFLRLAHVEAATTAQLQSEVDRMHEVEGRLVTLRREASKLDDVAAPLLDAVGGRGAWLEIVDDLNARLPKENIWITELSPMSGGHVLSESGSSATPPPMATASPVHGAHPAATPARPMIDGVFVRGLYLFNPKQQEVVVDYFRNLLGSKVFEVDPNEQSKVIKPSTPTASEWAYPYELRLKLREPLPLP
jgi:hypothetical protein